MYYLATPTQHQSGVVTVFDFQRGLSYRGGKFVEVLPPGRYRIWPFSRRVISVVDLRGQTLAANSQKLLTADQVALTVSLSVSVEVSDPVAYAHKVANPAARLYEDVQLAARALIGGRTLDALLAERDPFNDQLRQAVAMKAEAYGLRVTGAGLKDVILAPKLRDLLMKEVETKRLAQAALTAAREEAATLRALANAARLVAENPHLLSLREIEVLRAFAQTPGNTVVLGNPAPLRPRAGGRRGPEATAPRGE
jgi:regulator of protease activity HflC (stomatin/prohibitin superfamily)